ncbi:hypothetical protein [Methylomonas koyamae]|nr:hypothetical protein [Methylomonas koyamae]BBL58230.1 hypothetical protein MKFW12EY_18430 [Methylomonas koyamae]
MFGLKSERDRHIAVLRYQIRLDIERYRSNFGCSLALLAAFLTPTGLIAAELSNFTVTDVTTRAFSIVWVADQPVESAKIKVFNDEQGISEITQNVSVKLVSPSAALQRGIVKIDVTGLVAETPYYVSGEITDRAGALSSFPKNAEPLLAVRTAKEANRIDGDGQSIANDLIRQPVADVDGSSAAGGTLVLIDVPAKSLYPVAAFVNQDQSGSSVLVDLNNVFAKFNSSSLKINPGEPLEIKQFRGNVCDESKQVLSIFRRLPKSDVAVNAAKITELQTCFSPDGKATDFNCDGNIGFGDFNLFLGKFGTTNDSQSPSCSFNRDFDLNNDKTIDFGDFNLFLSVFGKVEKPDSQP